MKGRMYMGLLSMVGLYPLTIGIHLLISEFRKPGPDWVEACAWAGLIILLGVNIVFFCLRSCFEGLGRSSEVDSAQKASSKR